MAHVPIPLTSMQTAPNVMGRRSPMVCPLAKLGRSSPTMDHPRYRRSPSIDVAYRRSPLDPSVYSHLRGTPSPLEPSVYIHHFPPKIPHDPLGYRNVAPPIREAAPNYRNQSSFRNLAGGIRETTFRSPPSDSSGFRSHQIHQIHQVSDEITNYRLPDEIPARPRLSMMNSSSAFGPRMLNKSQLLSADTSMYQQHTVPHDPLRCSPALRRASSPVVDNSFVYQTTSLDASFKLGRSSPLLDQGYHTLVSPSPGPWTDYNPLCPTIPSSKGKKLYSSSGSSTKSSSASSVFDRLPDEAIVKIFSWLDSSQLCACARVCKRWEVLAWEPQLWRTIKLSGENLSGDKAVRCVLRRLCGHGTTGACPTVETVVVTDGARVTDKGLTQLARRCTEMSHLQLQGCSAITNNALFELASKCTNLQHLDLTGCIRITCLTVTPGPDPPSRLLLQYLNLTDCAAIDDGGLKVIVRNCPQLVYLYLRRCTQITDTGIKFVPSFCSTLREISVSDCNRVTDFGLHELAKLGATLRYLSVAKCDQVSDAGLKVIARRCYKLRYLNARGCEAVSDDAITVLARSCPRLRALDIGKCDVSDAGLRALAESCPNLKKLSLRNCDLVTDRGVQCIAYYCRGLQQLNIQDCQISVDGYRAVKKYCKRCIIEHTNPGFF